MSDLDLTIKQIIDKYSLLSNRSHAKSFGQNFICDYSLLKKIASCAAPFPSGHDIIEIGPGPGGLTRAIIELSPEGSQVFCVEKDISLKDAHDNLKSCYKNNRLNFIYKDALNVDLADLTSKNIIIISNLPYNVGTRLLINWLHNLKNIKKMILTFQKEVADRIVAKTGGKEYGRLSIISQLLCNCEKVFDISNKAFYPAPKIMSTVVKLIPKDLSSLNIEKLAKITAICFQHRRKTIFSSMRNHYNHETLKKALSECAINPMHRPETVSPQQFLKLTTYLH